MAAEEESECLMCVKPIADIGVGISACNHRDVCAECVLKMRELHQLKYCPLCKVRARR